MTLDIPNENAIPGPPESDGAGQGQGKGKGKSKATGKGKQCSKCLFGLLYVLIIDRTNNKQCHHHRNVVFIVILTSHHEDTLESDPHDTKVDEDLLETVEDWLDDDDSTDDLVTGSSSKFSAAIAKEVSGESCLALLSC